MESARAAPMDDAQPSPDQPSMTICQMCTPDTGKALSSKVRDLLHPPRGADASSALRVGEKNRYPEVLTGEGRWKNDWEMRRLIHKALSERGSARRYMPSVPDFPVPAPRFERRYEEKSYGDQWLEDHARHQEEQRRLDMEYKLRAQEEELRAMRWRDYYQGIADDQRRRDEEAQHRREEQRLRDENFRLEEERRRERLRAVERYRQEEIRRQETDPFRPVEGLPRPIGP